MHAYTVYVVGVPDVASHLPIGHWRWCPRWSILWNVWHKKKEEESIRWPWDKSQVLYRTALFFYRRQCKSESLRILKPFVSWTVKVSSKAPYSAVLKWRKEKKKKQRCHFFGLICTVDWTSCNIKSCLIKVQFACRTSLIVMAFKCQRIPSH